MSNVVWQLPVKQSNVTNSDWVHPKSKYHAYINDVSLCKKYSQNTSFFETTIEASKLMLNKEMACKICLKKNTIKALFGRKGGRYMNEVKYRIYGKENQIMYSWEEILNFDSLKDTLKNGGKEDQYYSPLLQYAEVKDSRGTEIYAGDICKRTVFAFGESRNFVGQVMMFEGCWWIDNGTAAVPLWNEMHILEVIGNVYENTNNCI